MEAPLCPVIAQPLEGSAKSNWVTPSAAPPLRSKLSFPGRICQDFAPSDEAHRFAVSYFSKLKRKSLVSSELLNIKGVGRMVYKNLMDSLGSVENVKNAPVNQLLGIKGVNKTVAQNIYDYFHNDRANSFNLPIK